MKQIFLAAILVSFLAVADANDCVQVSQEIEDQWPHHQEIAVYIAQNFSKVRECIESKQLSPDAQHELNWLCLWPDYLFSKDPTSGITFMQICAKLGYAPLDRL